MKNILALIVLMSLLSSCRFTSGSGDIVTSNRNTSDFKSVSAGGGFDVEIRTGSNYKVMVEADDNLIDDIETTVEGGQLKIRMRKNLNVRNAHLKIFVTAPSITSIQSSASADIVVAGNLRADETIRFKASSGSSIKASIDAPATEADASSGAQIDIDGRTRNFDVQASSGADVDADKLLSENTTAQSSSGGTADVHASVTLHARASSGGTVNYRGAATVVKKENSGGSINKNN